MPTFNATLTSLTPAFTFNGEASLDLFGISVSGAGDVNGDGFDDVIVGAPYNDNNGQNNLGNARVLSGFDGSVLFNSDGDSAQDRFGISVSDAGDVNGDGFDDVIVGAFFDDNNGLSKSGSARILSGVDGAALFTFDGEGTEDRFGISVSSAGDVNGDGFDDVIVGAYQDDNNGYNSGSARVLSGVDGAVLFTFDGDDVDDRFGRSVSSAGDVNGDGFDDVMVGAYRDDNNGYNSGSILVLSGLDGAVLFTFDGDGAGDFFGISVSSAGDVNGDGFDDVIVGAYRDDKYGPTSGSARVLSGVDGAVLFTFNGDDTYDFFGFSVSDAGDVNGDGFDDVIVGAFRDANNGNNSGSARVLSGVDGAVLFTFDGDGAYDYFGFSVSGAGDVNGDGFDDVIVGASKDDNNGSNSGSARLFTTTGTGLLDSVRAFTEGDAATILDDNVAVADAVMDALNDGNGDYDGASLNIAREGGGNGDDVFAFAAMANVAVNGGNLEAGGVAIANFTAVGGVLNIAFTNGGTAPTTALVNEVLQGVTYDNQVQDPGLGLIEKTIFDWHFSDGSDVLSDTIIITKTGIDSNDVFGGTAGVDTINAGVGADTVNGLESADILNGQSGADNLNGDAGDDTINGGRGGDTINGGADNDSLYGSFGDDNIDGGDGDDLLRGNDHRDTLNGGNGNDNLHGGDHNDTLNGGTGNDQLFGDAGNDTLNGNRGNDKLFGGDGNDTLNGFRNNDVLRGQAGDDNLDGGDGNDFLFGGAGRDLLTGGSGTDTFVFNAGSQQDIILDFTNGTDIIDLRTRGFVDFNIDVLANAVQNGAQVDVTFGGDTLTIRSFLLADFDAGDVLL